MAEIIKIADAVVDELNGTSFDGVFSAKRLYLPRFDLKEMDTIHVSVVPKATTITLADRHRTFTEYSVDIAVQKRLKPDTGLPGDPETDELDQLMIVVEDIADHLRFRTLANYPDAAWVGLSNDPIYSIEHLEQMRQFTSLLTATYRVLRAGSELVQT